MTTGREFFEKVYADEMAIPDGHVFGEVGEIDFTDPTMREAAYAGFVLAQSTVRDAAYQLRMTARNLRARINAEAEAALRVIEDQGDLLDNFAAQVNMHTARRNPGLPDAMDIVHLENVQEYDLKYVQTLAAPRASHKMPFVTVDDCPAFSVSYLLEFDKLYPVAYRYMNLVMANGIGPANAKYQQNVFIVLSVKGDYDLMQLTYAENVREAMAALQKIAAACQNICPVGTIRPLGSTLDGGHVEALVLPLCIDHHDFMMVQKQWSVKLGELKNA